jgi:hypothetical protein
MPLSASYMVQEYNSLAELTGRRITEIVRLVETLCLNELFDQNGKLIDSSATSAAGLELLCDSQRVRAVSDLYCSTK